jgi:Trk K+ transport system NAD-binding subunit
VRAYQVGIGRRLDLQDRADKLRLGKLTGTEFIEILIEPGSPAIGKKVGKLSLPEECLLTTARRGNKVILLHGHTTIRENDRIVALVDPACALQVRQAFQPLGTEGSAQAGSVE